MRVHQDGGTQVLGSLRGESNFRVSFSEDCRQLRLNGPPPNGSGFSFMLTALNPACCGPADSPIAEFVPSTGYESRLRCSTLPDDTECMDVSSVSPTSACGGSRWDSQASSSLATLQSGHAGPTFGVRSIHPRHARFVSADYGSNRSGSISASIRCHLGTPVRSAGSPFAFHGLQAASSERVTTRPSCRPSGIGQSVAPLADWSEPRRSDTVRP